MNWENMLKKYVIIKKQELYHIFVKCMVEGGQFRGLREHLNNMRLRTTQWKTEATTEPRSEIVGPENFLIMFHHTTENLRNTVSVLGQNEIIYLEGMALQGYGGNRQFHLNEGQIAFIMGMFKDEYPSIFKQMMHLVDKTMREHDKEMAADDDGWNYEE